MARSKVTITSPKGLELLKKSFDELTDNVGLAVEKQARETAPRSEYGNDNHYMDNINYYSKSKTVIAEMEYSADIEYGTKPHEIQAKTAKALHFKKDGKDVFVKKVQHPGTKPNPVMRNAAKAVQEQVNEIWEKTLKSNGL